MADISPVSLETLAPWGAELLDPQRIMTADELLHDAAHEKGYACSARFHVSTAYYFHINDSP